VTSSRPALKSNPCDAATSSPKTFCLSTSYARSMIDTFGFFGALRILQEARPGLCERREHGHHFVGGRAGFEPVQKGVVWLAGVAETLGALNHELDHLLQPRLEGLEVPVLPGLGHLPCARLVVLANSSTSDLGSLVALS